MKRKTFIQTILIAFLLLALPGLAQVQQGDIWLEAEEADLKRWPDINQSPFSPMNEDEESMLSGGTWMSMEVKPDGQDYKLEYEFEVIEDGIYSIYTRKFWKHGYFWWWVDDNEDDKGYVGRDVGLIDSEVIRDKMPANWTYTGAVELKKGKHRLHIQPDTRPGIASPVFGFDVFYITKSSTIPRGRNKPGTLVDFDPVEGWFPWNIQGEAETFTDSPIDLSYLNEDLAGQDGFIEKDGENFTTGKGEKIRFWGNGGLGSAVLNMDPRFYEGYAKWLAKYGVNLIRVHTPLFKSGDPKTFDEKKINKIHALIYYMKQEGIYVKISILFPLWLNEHASKVVPDAHHSAWGLIFFNDEVNKWFRDYQQKMFASKSPYTGLTFAEEPAVALFEILNEDSLLFSTFHPNSWHPKFAEEIKTLYAEFLLEKYGSWSAIKTVWGDRESGRIKENEGIVEMKGAGWMNVARPPYIDETQFVAKVERDFYKKQVKFLKEEIGLQSLIVVNNWKTAYDDKLLYVLRYIYEEGDVIDRHGYRSPKLHSGEGSSYRVAKNHRFESKSAWFEPHIVPSQFVQNAYYPTIISELNHPNPTWYGAETPFFNSVFPSLQGIDGIFNFASGKVFWETAQMQKFPFDTPHMMGQFPVFALLYRKGYVRETPPIIQSTIPVFELYEKETSTLQEADISDALRGGGSGGLASGLYKYAFLIGKTVRSYDTFGTERSVKGPDLENYVDGDKKQIRSYYDETLVDYGKGYGMVNAAKVQGVGGVLKSQKKFEMDNFTVVSENEYQNVFAISLDDKPLKSSESILIQSMTDNKPYGFKVTGNGVITDVGRAPYMVRDISGTVYLELRRGDYTVTELSHLGYPRKSYDAKKEDGKIKIELPRDTLYVHVQKK